MLRELSQDVQGIEQMHVFLEIVLVFGMEQELPFERLVTDLLQ